MLNVGDPAPNFTLPDQEGKLHTLEDYRGRWVVLYFYPKDDTPGCTKEACSFRDEKGRLEELGAVVLGVSADDVQSHGRFHGKYGLNFPLLSDSEKQTIRAYGAWGTKTMYGKAYEGVLRHTYLIDPAGRVARVWDKVKPDEHALEVAEALQELQQQRVGGNSVS
ncbi:thioredoxin-dependent thiol peroxidase [Meiothermus taiwanensis]|jgi:peroxiredoxin Q/BCP|uniref:thioredoxin-dependent peroxiredoxin n=1 Tax=Meiothermus taiwanensis TaxID=172827 RepID=A0A399E9B6_9DEIN|nr:thioredoxin-dependent thiol peroxidase [Meiothermus taiwanensis]KIQ55035.1 thiol peroxidase [Meiothermus taiwanensis]KZK14762.1 thiol peroxidase [Meiothermus taiwanensis]RIH79400.1 putative peroxiredoxin bcp [Meiothermus taiwanensis]